MGPILTEDKARRVVHIAGAFIVAFTMAVVIWAATGGARWAKQRQLRSIQSAARADLLLVYEAEKTFFKSYGFYTTDLKSLNLWPKNVVYAFGFVKAATFKEARVPGFDPEMRTILRLAKARARDAIERSKVDPMIKPNPPIVLSPLTKVEDVSFDRLISFCPDCTATESTFKVISAAQLDEDAVLDVWTIDQTGTIRHLIDDLH